VEEKQKEMFLFLYPEELFDTIGAGMKGLRDREKNFFNQYSLKMR
jgi:hypothetical protein